MIKLLTILSSKKLNPYSITQIYLSQCHWRNVEGKIYQELGLESLQQRRWYGKVRLFFRIYKN